MTETTVTVVTDCPDGSCDPFEILGRPDDTVRVGGTDTRQDQVGYQITDLAEDGGSIVVCWLHQGTATNDALDHGAGMSRIVTLDWGRICPLCTAGRPVDVHGRFDGTAICAEQPMAGIVCGNEAHHVGPCEPLPCDACLAGDDGPCNC